MFSSHMTSLFKMGKKAHQMSSGERNISDMRVLIIAPTPMSQAGLHTLLSASDIQVVGMMTAREFVSERAASADVFVVADDIDISVEEILRILPLSNRSAIIVLTSKPEPFIQLLSSSDLAAWGLVPLDTTPTQLQSAVHATAQGLVVLPISSARALVGRQTHREPALLSALEESLTPREREVLELVGQGLSNKLIARQLQISEHTVKFHLASVSTKLGAVSRTDAVRLGLRQGLITL
jgi:DNA-binding NarL/FixJ family response regulator